MRPIPTTSAEQGVIFKAETLEHHKRNGWVAPDATTPARFSVPMPNAADTASMLKVSQIIRCCISDLATNYGRYTYCASVASMGGEDAGYYWEAREYFRVRMNTDIREDNELYGDNEKEVSP